MVSSHRELFFVRLSKQIIDFNLLLMAPTENKSDLAVYSLQVRFMSGALVGLNLLLMIFVYFYWTNSNVHQFITRSPL